MDKKKIGELDGTPIVTGKKNYANEHEYYLTMNEDNTYQKLEQRVSGDKFRLVLGGGNNNYPTVTAGDVNKVWQVTPVQKGTKTESFDILHEYTDTFHYGENLIPDATNLDKFTAGSKCILTVTGDAGYNGNIYEGFINKNLTVIFNDTPFQFYIAQYGLVFNCGGDGDELTLSLSVEQSTTIYDYNWAPGVKIPIPTAEDEGKILVVTKVEGDNTSTIVPEQEVPEDNQTPLTDVDLKYFVPGNTVTATVTIQQGSDEEEKKGGDVLLKGTESSNSQTMIVSGIIEQEEHPIGTLNSVTFNEGQEDEFSIYKIPLTPSIPGEGVIKSINTKSSSDTEYILVTNLYEIFGGGIEPPIEPSRGNTIPYATIKLEYGEPNYEYKLQENSGSGSGSGSTSVATIDKNIQPNIVWREPTEEDLAKFHTGDVREVADLPEGKLPLFLVTKYTEDGVEYTEVATVASVIPSTSGNDTRVYLSGQDGSVLVLADDWSLLGTVGSM